MVLSSNAEVRGLVAGFESGRTLDEECVRGGRKAGDGGAGRAYLLTNRWCSALNLSRM